MPSGSNVAGRMSELLRRDERLLPGSWKALVNSLTDEQKDRIRAKCQWEHCSWMAVLRDWPDLFELEVSDGR